jgi:hypothetical protein
MNLILREDGILAFIGTKSEFGHYLSELKKDHGKDFRHCWTSLPAYTIMSMLGLCLNVPESGRPELVFYGSPKTLMLAYILDMDASGLWNEFLISQIENSNERLGYWCMETSMPSQIRPMYPLMVNASEYQEALSYFKDKEVGALHMTEENTNVCA